MQARSEILGNENGGFDLVAGDNLVPVYDKRLIWITLESTYVSSQILNGSNSESVGHLIVDIVVV
jgi:hypothetical protein